MAIKLGELFVEIAEKGSSKVVAGISGVAGAAMDAKFKILGTIFAMERMTAFSRNLGMSLNQFANFTGMSAEQLQKWQWAGKQVGATSEDVEASFKNLQKALGDQINLGKPIEKLGLVYDKLGDLDFKRIEKGDVTYLMNELQRYAQLEGNITRANDVLSSMGISEGMIVALREGAFTKERMAKAPIFNKDEIKTLKDMQVSWNNIVYDFQIGIGKMSKEFGPTFMDSIGQMARALTMLTQSLLSVVKAFGLIEKASSGVKTISKTLDLVSKGKFLDEVGQGVRSFIRGQVKDSETLSKIFKVTPDSSNLDSKLIPSTTNQTMNVNVKNSVIMNGSEATPEAVGREQEESMQRAILQLPQGQVK